MRVREGYSCKANDIYFDGNIKIFDEIVYI